jgi:hypothetical protein
MKIDLYSKIVLTVIALSLTAIALHDFEIVKPVKAQLSSPSVFIAGINPNLLNPDMNNGQVPSLPVTIINPTPVPTVIENQSPILTRDTQYNR